MNGDRKTGLNRFLGFVQFSLLALMLSAQAEAGDSVKAYRVSIPATKGAILISSPASIDASGSEGVDKIRFENSLGSIQIQGVAHSAFIQEAIQWGKLTLYQGMAFDRADWKIFWIYCDQSGNATEAFIEGMTGNHVVSGLTGTCALSKNESKQITPTNIELPAINLNSITPVTGFNLEGKGISLKSGEVGTYTNYYDETNQFIAFNIVDCTHQCTPEGVPGWTELHSIFLNKNRNKYCFGIIYLHENRAQNIQISHSLCLNDLDRSIEGLAFPEATWSSSK